MTDNESFNSEGRYTGGDPTDVAICYGGPEDGREVRWQGVACAHVPIMPEVKGVLPTWDELNVPMRYSRYIRDEKVYRYGGIVGWDFERITDV